MRKKELKTLISNTVLLYVLQISSIVLPLISFPYLTRVLGPEKFGIYVFANAAMIYFQMLVDYGFTLSSTKDCSIHRDNKQVLSVIMSSVIQAKLTLSGVGFLILLMISKFLNTFADNMVFLLLSYIPVFLSAFIPDFLFRGLEKMNVITYRTLIMKIIYTILIFIVINDPNDYIFIPIINSLSTIIVIFFVWYFITYRLQINYKVMDIRSTFQAIRESSVFFFSRIASTVYGASNIFVLGLFHSNSALAQFGVANTLYTGLRSLFSPIADSLFPYMVNKKDFSLIKIVIVVAIPIIVAGVILLFVFAEPIILFVCGEEYIGAVPIFRAFLPIIVMTLPIYILGFPTLGAMNMMKEANMSVVYAAIFHLVGLVFLIVIRKIDLISVAILTCFSEGLLLLLRIIYVIYGKKRGKQVNETSC
mgnify:CR=1 FL=1